jgi:hypothetical protein
MREGGKNANKGPWPCLGVLSILMINVHEPLEMK